MWIAYLFSYVKNTTTLPKVKREAKVITILKPGKSGNDLKYYTPISLLSIVYKLFERDLRAMIQMTIEDTLPKEQAGFRQDKSCCE